MPAVSMRSLCAMGRPWSGPSGAPLACAWSALRAPFLAWSRTSVTIALTWGFTRSICKRCASRTSRELSAFLRIIDAISTAVMKQMSGAAPAKEGAAAAAPRICPACRRVIINGVYRRWSTIDRNAIFKHDHRGGRARMRRTGTCDYRRSSGRSGTHDVRKENMARDACGSSPEADAPRTARLSGGELQPDSTADASRSRRGFRDHGTGGVSADVGHQHDLRRDCAD